MKTINDDTIAFNLTENTPSVRFLASLSDGRTIIQDERSGTRHAWARVAEWLKANSNITITELRLQGAPGSSIEVKMPPNQQGYFFGFKRRAIWRGLQSTYIGIGYYDGSKVRIGWYRQPNFDHSFSENRSVAEAGFFLIRNV